MKIGDRIYVRGYIDEIRKDTVIVRNDGGYFGTIPSEVTPSAQPEVLACGEGELSAQSERTGRWIDYVKDGYVECPFCHSATTCNDNISDLHFCFSCGARMEGEE